MNYFVSFCVITTDGTQAIGNTEASFRHNPPTIEDIREVEENIKKNAKETYGLSIGVASIIGYFPLSEW